MAFHFFKFILVYGPKKKISNLVAFHFQNWVWLLWPQSPEIDCILRMNACLHADINSGKLKVTSMIFEWLWSKMGLLFYRLWDSLTDVLHAVCDAVISG